MSRSRRSGADPDRDSIVRTEASRLRKRPAQYYQTEGADHAIQIVVPDGGYIPCSSGVSRRAQEVPQPSAPIDQPPSEQPPAPGAAFIPSKAPRSWTRRPDYRIDFNRATLSSITFSAAPGP
jgi:hypothetical protein